MNVPEGSGLRGVSCQAMPGTSYILCRPTLPSVGTVSIEPSTKPPELPVSIPLPDAIDTRFYRVRIDRGTGALTSLQLKPSGREMLGGPANVIVAEKPKTQAGDPGDHMLDRPERLALANSSQFRPRISVPSGPLATTVEVESGLLWRRPHGQDHPLLRRLSAHRFRDRAERHPRPHRSGGRVPAEGGDCRNPPRHSLRLLARGVVQAEPRPARLDERDRPRGALVALRVGRRRGSGAARPRPLRARGDREDPDHFLLNATDKYYGYDNPWLSGKGKHRLEYALVAHDSAWDEARIPQLAWEYSCPPVAIPNCGKTASRSFVKTSENVIVEAIRREGSEIELRLAECLGIAGYAEVDLSLPHTQAALTDLAGANRVPLRPASVYRFPVRPQQIVTMRFRTRNAVAEIQPLTDWNPLVPEAKRAALNTRIDKKGHPPRGDAPKDPGSHEH